MNTETMLGGPFNGYKLLFLFLGASPLRICPIVLFNTELRQGR